MKMKFFLTLIAIVVVISAVIYVKSWTDKQSSAIANASPFNITFSYGVGAKNVLNSFNQTYTKDMVVDPPITVPLILSDIELNGLRTKIDELDIFAPQEVREVNTFVNPCISYNLLVERDGVHSNLEWDCEKQGSNESLDALNDYIQSILETKDTYKKLPEAQGGYM